MAVGTYSPAVRQLIGEVEKFQEDSSNESVITRLAESISVENESLTFHDRMALDDLKVNFLGGDDLNPLAKRLSELITPLVQPEKIAFSLSQVSLDVLDSLDADDYSLEEVTKILVTLFPKNPELVLEKMRAILDQKEQFVVLKQVMLIPSDDLVYLKMLTVLSLYEPGLSLQVIRKISNSQLRGNAFDRLVRNYPKQLLQLDTSAYLEPHEVAPVNQLILKIFGTLGLKWHDHFTDNNFIFYGLNPHSSSQDREVMLRLVTLYGKSMSFAQLALFNSQIKEIAEVTDQVEQLKDLSKALWTRESYNRLKIATGEYALAGLNHLTLRQKDLFELLDANVVSKPRAVAAYAQDLKNQADYFLVYSNLVLYHPIIAAQYLDPPFETLTLPDYIHYAPLLKDGLLKLPKDDILEVALSYQMEALAIALNPAFELCELDRLEIIDRVCGQDKVWAFVNVIRLQPLTSLDALNFLGAMFGSESDTYKFQLVNAVVANPLKRRALFKFGFKALAADPILLEDLEVKNIAAQDGNRILHQGICHGWTMQMLAQDETAIDPLAVENKARFTQALYELSNTLPLTERVQELTPPVEVNRFLKLEVLGATETFKLEEGVSVVSVKEGVAELPTHNGLLLNLKFKNDYNHSVYVNPNTRTIVDQNVFDDKGNPRVLNFNKLDSFYEGLICFINLNYPKTSGFSFIAYDKLASEAVRQL